MKQRLLPKILKTFSLQLFPKEKLILNFYRIIYLTIFPSPLDPSRYVSVFFFSYLLNFCREWWHLCKFLILGDLSPHLFGLIFPCPTSEKIRVGFHRTHLSSIKGRFFKTLFFEKQFKKVTQALFIYFCVYTSTANFQAFWPFISWVKI